MQTGKPKAFFRVFFSLKFDDWLLIGYFRNMPGCVKVVHPVSVATLRETTISRASERLSSSRSFRTHRRESHKCV
jgi:hypothetical protein